MSSFASRTLNGFWVGEYVPAYASPRDHGYLLNQNYAPAGTSLINGVEVEGLGKVGVSILASLDLSTTLPRRVSGTATGEGSSATNWAIPFGPASYKVILHCTSDFERGYSR